MNSKTIGMALLGFATVAAIVAVVGTGETGNPDKEASASPATAEVRPNPTDVAAREITTDTPHTAVPTPAGKDQKRVELPGLLLVGTAQASTAQATATLLVIGQALRTYAVGSRIEGSPLVLAEVRTDSVLLRSPEAGQEVEVGLTPAGEISRRWPGGISAAQQQVAAGMVSQPLPPSETTVLRDADSPGGLPKEMQVTVRRQRQQQLGPVGSI